MPAGTDKLLKAPRFRTVSSFQKSGFVARPTLRRRSWISLKHDPEKATPHLVHAFLFLFLAEASNLFLSLQEIGKYFLRMFHP
jgi:hypothetical protein